MEEDEYQKMLDHLQKYVPHLEKLITQLKDPKKKNRELQLSKLEGLHSMITDRKKKLKLDTLKKCEDVILKILQKVHPTIYKQLEQTEQRNAPYTKFLCKDPPGEHNSLMETEVLKTARLQAARARLSEISAPTPASPSPPRDITIMRPPIVIPTEKVNRKPNPDDFQINNWEKTFETKHHRLTNNKHVESYKTEKPDVYRRAAESLTANLPKKPVFERLGTRVDMSVPPLSAEDLQELTESDAVSVMELEHVRDDLKKKLIQEEDDRFGLPDLRTKLTRDRQHSVQTQKTKPSSVKPRVEKIFKDPDSKFGNLLSSIDEQILVKKDKKDEKRPKSEKDTKDTKDTKHRHKSKKRDRSKDRHRSNKDHKSKRHDKPKEEVRSKDKPKSETQTQDKPKQDERKKESDRAVAESKEKDDAAQKQVFKRLADKYNPRPRKNSVDVVEVPHSVAKEPLFFNKELVLPAVKDTDAYLTNIKDTGYLPNPVKDVWNSNFGLIQQKTPEFVPPPSPMPTGRGGNTYLNTFIVQNNVGGNIPHNQFQPPATTTFHNPIQQVFHPYDPIANNEYELNKMQPVDYFPQGFKQQQQQPRQNFQNRVFQQQQQQPFGGRDQQRPFVDPWLQDPRTAARRDENPPPVFNRDPRIRSREQKELIQKNTFFPPMPQTKRRSIDEYPTYPQTKYDSMYSHLERAKSKEETFMSPLDSLYSVGGVNNQRTGKGYGVQKFRIPKVKHDVEYAKIEEPPAPPKIVELPDEEEDVPVVVPEEKPEEKPDEKEQLAKASPTEQSIIADFLANLIQGSDKKHILNALVHSLSGTVSDQQKKKFKRIQKIMDSESEPDEPEETSKPVDDEEKPVAPETVKLIEEVAAPVDEVTGDVEKSPVLPKKKIRKKSKIQKAMRRKSRRNMLKAKKLAATAAETPDNTDSVVETVGERIKNRRRNIPSTDGPKFRKCTELDRLHNDIKEMFICNGVLTATGKRMCRILKSDSQTNDDQAETAPKAAKNDEEAVGLDSPKRRARTSNPKVVIEKTDLSKLVVPPKFDSESETESTDAPMKTRRQLVRRKTIDGDSASDGKRSASKRATKTKPNYVEATEEEFPLIRATPKTPKEKEDVAENEEDKEKENVEEKEEVERDLPERRMKRKRRGHSWAIGVINKKVAKKKASSASVDDSEVNESTPEEQAAAREKSAVPANKSKHDKDYYYDPLEKSDCKICQFKGKYIIQHYKSVHPKHEVLISRVSPENSQKAIDESIESNYDEVEAIDVWETKHRKKRFTYQCRFCQVFFKNESSDSFFDHITGHTGEYRFHCNLCTFKTANGKSLRAHLHSSHQTNCDQVGSIVPIYPASPNFSIVFGYMCAGCHFIQLDKSIIENHIKVQHHDEDVTIYKINMSTVTTKSPTVSNESTATEVPDEVTPPQDNVVATSETENVPTAPVEVIEETKSDDTVEAAKPAEIVEEPTPVTVDEAALVQVAEAKSPEVVPDEIAEPKPAEITEKAKEDPTVFKYNMQYTKESKILDEEKHEKMQEINQNIVPKKKFSFNLLDKIKSRLDDKNSESETVEESTEVTSASEEEEEECVSTVTNVTELTPTVDVVKTVVKHECKTSVEKPVLTKSSVPIINIIERLQGKLNNTETTQPPSLNNVVETTQSPPLNIVETTQPPPLNIVETTQPPPLIPISEINLNIKPETEEVVIHVGPIAACKKKDYTLYICYMQSCTYSSVHANEFELHCKSFHGNRQWDGVCNMCNVDTGFTEVEDAYHHLMDAHKSELGIDNSEDDQKTEIKATTYLRMRRLSGDKLSEQRRLSSDTSEKTSDDGVIINSEDSPFKIVDVHSEVQDDSWLKILSVTTLTAEEEKQAFNVPCSTTIISPQIPPLAVIDSLASSGNLTSVSTATSISIQSPTLNFVLPMLSPIPGSPPKKATTPMLIPLSNSNTQLTVNVTPFAPNKHHQSKRIILKDVPLQAHELITPRKTPYACNCLLAEQKLIHLYKCPERSCSFSTDVKRLFEVHLKQHNEFRPGMEISCLYCNFKTEFRLFAVHYDVRHGRCQYCCVYCFYRAINQSYVEMHQEREHAKSKRRVLMAPINPDALTSTAQINLPPIKSIVPLHICGQRGCESKFIFHQDFANHCLIAHGGTPMSCYYCTYTSTSGHDAAIHMQMHNVCLYHCRYCLYGGNTLEEVYRHLSLQHFALHAKILERKFIPDATNTLSYEYKHDDPKAFERLNVITAEYAKYVTPSVLIEAVTSYGTGRTSKPLIKKSATITKLPDKNETITLYKAPMPNVFKKPPVSITLIEQQQQQQPKVTEASVQPNDLEIIKISDVPMKPNVRAQSPIVLNNFLKSPADLLTITRSIAKEAVDKIITPVKKPSDFIIVQSEPINLDDTVIDITDEVEKTSVADPLLLEPEPTLSASKTTTTNTDTTFTEKASFTDEDLAGFTSDDQTSLTDNANKKEGLFGKDLFRCSVCLEAFINFHMYKTHIVECTQIHRAGLTKPFSCCHCLKSFKTAITLLDHIHVHGVHRFACSLCDYKFGHQIQVRTHMKTRHNVTNVTVIPIDPNKNNMFEDEFVLRPKIKRQISSEGLIIKDSLSSANESTLQFGPEDVDVVPLRPIFNHEVKCSMCGYATKVRANLIRHFQFHQTGKEVPIPATAPVNPVPCLDKNEKMFDKMTNLSMSSYTDSVRNAATKTEKKEQPILTKDEEAELPMFVPATKRYVCGADSCDYLCLEESMLRSHLQALHSDETSYKCTHCQERLSKDKGAINIDQILKHLRLHDLNLYKCRHCKFLHYLKHKVDRHVVDKHPNCSPIVIIAREMDHEPKESSAVDEVKETKPWRCGMCKYRCSAKTEMIAHVYNKHDLDTQFKCALCQYRTSKKLNFSSHFQNDHPGQSIEVIDAYYEEEPNVTPKNAIDFALFDTTPIWQREKTKMKHIRGIPIDESNKHPKKSPAKSDVDKPDVSKKIATSLPKKPKTLKEKKLEYTRHEESDIIEIDDEIIDILTVDETPPRKKVASPKKFKEVSMSQLRGDEDSQITLTELRDMDLALLKSSDLSGTYGPFGKPFCRQFLCPLCGTFKTRKAEDITHHLYKELHYPRFVCTNCGLTGITYNFLQKHSMKKHIGLPEAVHPISPDPKIEDWVHKVLVVQGRVIQETDSIPTVSSTTLLDNGDSTKPTMETKSPQKSCVTEINAADSSSATDDKPKFLHQCKHCEYTCKAASDLRKHEIRHWEQKPLKCGYCDSEGVTNYEIRQHSKRAHPTVEPLVVVIPTPSTPTIIPIVRKRKYPKNEGAITSSSDEIAVKVDVEQLENGPFESSVFVCHYCPKRCDTKEEQHEHWESTHRTKNLEFKYKLTSLNDVHKKGTLNYKCWYCRFVGNLESIKSHFKVSHPDTPLSVYRYKCHYCNKYFKSIDKVRAHYKNIHEDVIETCFDIDDPPRPLKEYLCEYCSMDFDIHAELLTHHNAMHSHLELVVPTEVVASASKSDEVDERKDYKCPHKQCNHMSNVYASMRDHVRCHAKPFQCGNCDLRFIYPSFVKSHHQKEHRHLEFSYHNSEEGSALYEDLKKSILALNANGEYKQISLAKPKRTKPQKTYPNKKIKLTESVVQRATARKSTTQIRPKIKQTARKSTTHVPTPRVEQDYGFSYYGQMPDLEGAENLKTILTFNDSYLRINFDQLQRIFDIFPTILLTDIKRGTNEL